MYYGAGLDVLTLARRRRMTVTSAAGLTRALAGAANYTTLLLTGGPYEGSFTIPRTVRGLTLMGIGGRAGASLEAIANAPALTNHADDVTLVNLGLSGFGTGGGLLNTGKRLRCFGGKIEGGADAAILAAGTDAEYTAGTKGDSSDVLFEDCEFCWATNGVVLRCSDYGAITQPRLRGCAFHNLDTAHLSERVGSGGSNSVGWRNLVVDGCTFDMAEDGTAPTKFLDLNDSNDNTGLVTGCAFPTAINSGLNLVSTKCLWVANRHTGGISAAQPS